MQQLSNTALVLVGDFDKVTGASGGLASLLVNALTPAMKALFSVAVGIQQVFSTLGKAVGGSVAAIAAVLRGEFSEAKSIMSEMATDVTQSWSNAGAAIAATWEQSTTATNTASESVGKLTAAVGKTAANAKSAANEVKRAAAEYQKWMDGMAADEDSYRQKLFAARLDEQEKEEKAHSDWLKEMADDEDKYRQLCTEIRDDGAYVDQGEQDNLIVQKIVGNPRAVGIFGYSYMEENGDRVQGLPMNGVDPTYDNIASFKYPGARPLFVYVKKAHMRAIPGLEDFMKEWVKSWGKTGPLAKVGMVAMPADAMQANAAKVQAEIQRTIIEAFKPGTGPADTLSIIGMDGYAPPEEILRDSPQANQAVTSGSGGLF
jgi:ABC-type phosphate transport system substrate-binding protein